MGMCKKPRLVRRLSSGTCGMHRRGEHSRGVKSEWWETHLQDTGTVRKCLEDLERGSV